MTEIHVVQPREAGSLGIWAELPRHAGANDGRWSTCGSVAEPDVRCAARRLHGVPSRCLKFAIVTLCYRVQRSRVDSEGRWLGLCGSHLVAHRNGTSLVVMVVMGRKA